MNQQIKIKEEAQKYFRMHYPLASQKEIDKQVEDWQNKISSGKSLVSFFKERVGDIPGKKVLDVGFGSGGIAIAFNLAGAVSYGVDVDPELKIIADKNIAENSAKAELKIYDGVNLPFPDNFFDYIVSSSVLEHVSFPEKLLNDVFRVLKPGGRFLLTLPNKYAPLETHTLAYFVSWMPRWMADWYLKILKRSPLKDDNLHFYSYFDILKMLRKTSYKYEIIYKDLSAVSVWKKNLILALKRFNIHYTAFLRQLIFIIEKK
jgi:ubiquinone/menaquinone biosynthesis C-methylase UbiE